MDDDVDVKSCLSNDDEDDDEDDGEDDDVGDESYVAIKLQLPGAPQL